MGPQRACYALGQRRPPGNATSVLQLQRALVNIGSLATAQIWLSLTVSPMLKTLSIVGYLGMVAGLIAQFATGNLFSSSPVAIAVQVGAGVLLVWARLTFGWRSFHVVANPTEGGLVTSGPYRYIRHPIYAAMVVFSGAGMAAHWSWSSGLLCGAVVGFAVLRIFCEEVMVTARYPEYRQYAAKTWRMIPYVF